MSAATEGVRLADAPTFSEVISERITTALLASAPAGTSFVRLLADLANTTGFSAREIATALWVDTSTLNVEHVGRIADALGVEAGSLVAGVTE